VMRFKQRPETAVRLPDFEIELRSPKRPPYELAQHAKAGQPRARAVRTDSPAAAPKEAKPSKISAVLEKAKTVGPHSSGWSGASG
jgi:hypothetical protein